MGIAIGEVALIHTTYVVSEQNHLRSASKGPLCHAVIELRRVGATCIDIQHQNPKNHLWQRL